MREWGWASGDSQFRNAPSPGPRRQTVANQFQTNGSFIYITKANYCSLINQHILISSALELGLPEIKQKWERKTEISALLYRNNFRLAVIAYPGKPEVSDIVKPTERKQVGITNKKSYVDDCSHVLITFPESLNLPPLGLLSWEGCVEVQCQMWAAYFVVRVCVFARVMLRSAREKDIQFTS